MVRRPRSSETPSIEEDRGLKSYKRKYCPGSESGVRINTRENCVLIADFRADDPHHKLPHFRDFNLRELLLPSLLKQSKTAHVYRGGSEGGDGHLQGIILAHPPAFGADPKPLRAYMGRVDPEVAESFMMTPYTSGSKTGVYN